MNHEKFARSFSYDICHLWPTVLKHQLFSNERSPSIRHLAVSSPFCYSVFDDYSPILAFVALGLERFCDKVSAILKKCALYFSPSATNASHLAFWQTPFCYSVFDDYSPVLAFVALQLLSFQTTLLSWHLWHWD